jgi:O-antigen/teichoic acid export membrane protein
MFARIKRFLFENTSTKQTVIKNAFWLTFGQLASRLIKAVLILYVARILGSAGYGAFSYALSLAAFFTIFSDIGISPILTREAAKNPALEQRYFSTALIMKSVLVIVSVVLITVVAPLFTNIPDTAQLFPIVAFLLAFDGFREFTFAISRAKERMQVEAGINIITNAAIVAFGMFAIFYAPTARNLTIGYTLGSGFGLLASLWILRAYLKYPWRSFDKGLIKVILSEAWPFALMGFLGGIMINTDTIMLGWLRTAEEVGYYSAAQRPVQMLYLISSILATTLFPSFARFAATDKERFRTLFEKSIKICFMFCLPIIIGGVILAKPLVLLLFGAQYAPAVGAFSVLLFTLIMVFPGTLIGNAVFAFNQQKSFVIFLAVGAFGNAIFNYILIRPYGIVGASIATILAQLLANGFTWIKLKKVADFSTLKHLPKILIASLVMGLFTWGLNILGTQVLVNIGAGVLVYLATLVILRESMLKEISQVFKKTV